MPVLKWSNRFYVDVYEFAKSGLQDKQIAKAIGVTPETFARWKAQKPAFRDACDRGRQGRGVGDEFSFREYVFRRLPPKLRDLWEEINQVETETNDIARVEAMLTKAGQRTRQHLFVYALTSSNFNVSKALRRLNIPRGTYLSWVREEPGFAELMDEIHWHKKNFFENALLARVAAGDTSAILFAARSQLRDRGYNDKIDINVNQEVNVNITQTTVNILELDLSLDVKKKILHAMRAGREGDQKTIEVQAT